MALPCDNGNTVTLGRCALLPFSIHDCRGPSTGMGTRGRTGAAGEGRVGGPSVIPADPCRGPTQGQRLSVNKKLIKPQRSRKHSRMGRGVFHLENKTSTLP